MAFIWAYFLCICRNYYMAMMNDEEKKIYDQEQKNKKSGLAGFIPKIPGTKEEEMK